MAPRKSCKSRYVARLVTGKKVPCGFCQRDVDDEITYGKLYAIGDIQCHYFCVLLSSCLIQKGKDEDGLFGFMYEDIIIEIERAKKHRCSYCSRGGANLGCSISQCRKQFHLPCGRERNSVSLFYGNYKSFCQLHAPKQNIPANIMSKARLRRISDGKIKKQDPNFKDLKELLNSNGGDETIATETQSVCVICYEAVEGYPTINTFWPPCCARDAWFHRSCLQRMALSAGMHYLKCPLCNDKENFYEAVVKQGYYVPDRDAAWELEQNAFAEIYERDVECSAADCQCPMGRGHDADTGSWCIKLCLLCGSSGVHSACLPSSTPHVCTVCTPAAPNHIEQLASCIQAVISQEQAQSSSRTRRGPVMPSRMSLRRTKRHVIGQNIPSCSSSSQITVKTEMHTPTINTASSREDLNLKTPKKWSNRDDINSIILERSIDNTGHSEKEDPTQNFESIENAILSPAKLLEESLRKKMGCSDVVVDEELVEELRRRFRRPKPLCEKRKIVNDILNGVFDNLLNEPKQKDPVKQWCSPKKCDIKQDMEIIEILDDSPPTKPVDERIKTSFKQENDMEPFATPKKSNLNLCLEIKTEPTYPIFNTPKKLKTVDILKDSSLEISAKDEIINIDMIKLDNSQSDEFLKGLELKSPMRSKKCAFKFSPINKEVLDIENIDMDVESFKDRYLNEMGLQRVKKVTEETKTTEKSTKRSSRKRKLNADGIVLKYESKSRKKKRNNISIKDKNIKVKIKWRKEKVRLKITDSKKKKKFKKYKQYILECSPKTCSTIKPKFDVTPPIKRKYKKPDKSPDNLVQTSIQKFFKIKTPVKE